MPNKSLIALAVGAAAALPFATASAATNADCIEIGLTGGWFSVFSNSRDFGAPVRNANNDDRITGTGDVNTVEPKYRFGGGISLSYQPCGQPYIWGLSWFGVQKKNVTATTGPIGFDRFGEFNTAASSTHTYGTRYQFATATLATIQALCCETVHIKPHLGVAYLDVKENRTVTLNNFAGDVGRVETFGESSRFHGVGPDIGIDLKYCFCGGFSLVGNLDYSALVGKNKGNANHRSTSVNWSNSRANHIVSHIQSEIGLAYNFAFCGCDRGDLVLGYRVTKMIDALSRFDNIIDYHNANLQGPFLRLNFGFNL